MTKFKAVIFDLDGTLTPKNSWLELSSFLDTDPVKHIDIFNLFIEQKLSLEDAKQQLLSMWQKSPNATQARLEVFFSKLPLRKNAHTIINYLRSQSIGLCLISSTVDTCVEQVAKGVGINDWYADSALVFNQEGKLVGFEYSAEQRNQKQKHFEKFLKQKSIKPTECLVVGDNENDIILFDLAKGGLTIGDSVPDELNQHATGHLKDLIEIKEYLI